MGIDAVILCGVEPERLTDEALRRWRWELGNLFPGEWRFAPNETYPRPPLVPDPYYTQTLGAGELEVLDADVAWRYYGEYYARGPGLQISALLEWLLGRFPVVWYGGDYGAPLDVVDSLAVEKLRRLWIDNGTLPYRRPRSGVSCPTCAQPTWDNNPHEFLCVGCRATARGEYDADNPPPLEAWEPPAL